jgi:hypothetical protein
MDIREKIAAIICEESEFINYYAKTDAILALEVEGAWYDNVKHGCQPGCEHEIKCDDLNTSLCFEHCLIPATIKDLIR